jgi:16S rRNA (adenine1518-N6/adenine1519-N6)-dimethyltransferase
MNLCSKKDLVDLLARHRIALARTYGQHFLVECRVLKKIAELAGSEKDLPTIEVGPGVGTLTRELAKNSAPVFAIERDQRFLPVLKETLAEYKNVEVVLGDALKVSLAGLISGDDGSGDYQIVSNLPYEITTPFLWKVLFDEPRRPKRMVLLLQAELVERVLQQPPKMNLLSLLAAFSGKAGKAFLVSQTSFYPPPRVRSAVLTIENIAPALSSEVRQAINLARRAFGAPRKKLGNTLGEMADRFADQRPAKLSADEWFEIA